jgi:hypothetical protein
MELLLRERRRKLYGKWSVEIETDESESEFRFGTGSTPPFANG